jgi:adenylyltransferase/sulfurtransferase
MGVLQALEAIKVITRTHSAADAGARPTTMLMLSAGGGAADGDLSFRTVRLKGRRRDCFACGDAPGLSLDAFASSMDYAQFCGVVHPVDVLRPEERVTVDEYSKVRGSSCPPPPHVLLDVREPEHYGLGSIAGSSNIPMSRFMRRSDDEVRGWLEDMARAEDPIYVVCRHGNDSQIVARKLIDLGLGKDGKRFVGDIKGGLKAWKDMVEPHMPLV